MLLNFTITELWNNFKALERPFLIRSGNRAEQVRKGDYWGDRDVGGSGDEKGGGGRKRDKSVKNTMGMEGTLSCVVVDRTLKRNWISSRDVSQR